MEAGKTNGEEIARIIEAFLERRDLEGAKALAAGLEEGVKKVVKDQLAPADQWAAGLVEEEAD